MRTAAHVATRTSTGRIHCLVDEARGFFAVLEALDEDPHLAAVFATVDQVLRAELGVSGPADERIDTALRRVNEVVHRLASDPQQGGLRGLRLGAAVAVLRGATAVVGHVGGPRIDLARVGDTTLRVVARPHTEAEAWVDAGLLRLTARTDSPCASRWTRFLGDLPEVEVDVATILVGAGDRLVLASSSARDLTSMDASGDGTELARAAVAIAGGEAAVVVVDVVWLLFSEPRSAKWERFARHPVARTLGRDDWNWLVGLGRCRRLQAGEVLLRPTEEATGVLIVVTGALVADGPTGRERWGAGSLHHLAVLWDGPRATDAYVQAEQRTVVVEVSRDIWLDQRYRHPLRVLRALAAMWRSGRMDRHAA